MHRMPKDSLVASIAKAGHSFERMTIRHFSIALSFLLGTAFAEEKGLSPMYFRFMGSDTGQ